MPERVYLFTAASCPSARRRGRLNLHSFYVKYLKWLARNIGTVTAVTSAAEKGVSAVHNTC